ncbi:MAG TPA: hypothetical protein VKQ36_14455 [Ktedonobacterales bacterium]|nr:hypothetical protein [Ktedonobacterales bacterium]
MAKSTSQGDVLSPMSSANPEALVKSARPHLWELGLHPVKAVRFVYSLATDRRVALLLKLLYIGALALLLIALLVPEGLLAALVAVALPFVGPAINLPADGVVDWLVLGAAAYGLLALFPRAIVSEHHARLFHPGRVARQARQ